jgi:hypothetical protein
MGTVTAAGKPPDASLTPPETRSPRDDAYLLTLTV